MPDTKDFRTIDEQLKVLRKEDCSLKIKRRL